MKTRKCLLCSRAFDGPGSYHPECRETLLKMRGGKRRRGSRSVRGTPEWVADRKAHMEATAARIERELAALPKDELESRGLD